MAAQPDVLSPLWWVHRLQRKLIARAPLVQKHEDYYEGNHPLPWLPEQARVEFRRILRMTRSNYMGLVVDSKAERMNVDGFRVDNGDTVDDVAQGIWQSNCLDAESDQAITDMLIDGSSYLLVDEGENPGDDPIITVESAMQCILEYAPGGNMRTPLAGLKVWMDDIDGFLYSTLYLPDSVHKFQAPLPKVAMVRQLSRWVPRIDLETGEEIEAFDTPLGKIPMFELPNKPRSGRCGTSELSDLTDIQDRINKTIADRLVTQDFGAFPQKWATGFPQEDEDGNPVPPIDIGRDRLVETDAEGAKFGQWTAEPLDPYSSAKREDVKDIASRSRTPAQYLLGEISNVNGETLKAAESGLISTVRQRCKFAEIGLEGAMGYAIELKTGAAPTKIETIWRNPEFRTEGETVDALVKMSTLGVPQEALWERWGATPEEIKRWKQQQTDAAARTGLGDLGALFRPKGDSTPPAE